MCCAVFFSSFFLTGVILSAGATSEDETAGGYAFTAYAPEDTAIYILRTFNGNIAIFYGEFQNEPAIETEIKVEKLRAVDRALLDAGIEVEKYEDVLKLLEDFGS